MGEAAGTIFTILLFVAAFLGSGAYAVLSIADFRSAKRGFWATAISFAAIGVVLGLMTTWPLLARISIAALFAAIAFGSLVWVLDYLKIRERMGVENVGQSETGRLVSQAQFAKVAEVEAFFGGKDENDLRQLFDLPNILQKNINTQIIRIGFIKSGKEKDFFYNNYTDNGSWIVWAKPGAYTIGPGGVHMNTGSKDVHHLVTTTKFQNSQKRLVEFANSALVPDSIKTEINAFNEVLANDTSLMTQTLDERMHEDENFFLQNMDMGSKYYGVITTDFSRRLLHLKPPADRVLAAIAASWKLSK
jgi:hypothetical protein